MNKNQLVAYSWKVVGSSRVKGKGIWYICINVFRRVFYIEDRKVGIVLYNNEKLTIFYLYI